MTGHPGHGPVRGTPDTAVSPDPPENHKGTTASERARGARGTDPDTLNGAAEVGEFFERLSGMDSRWRLTTGQRRRLCPAVADALAAGWTPGTLAEVTGANTARIRNPAAVLAARLSLAELPSPPVPRLPSWCGECDQATRMLDWDGDAPRPCPRCKGPLAAVTAPLGLTADMTGVGPPGR